MPKPYDVNFLYNIRKSKMMSQKEFAELLCVSRQTYSLIEKDCGRMPLEMYLKIITYFELSVSEILKSTQPNSKNEVDLISELIDIKREIQGLKLSISI